MKHPIWHLTLLLFTLVFQNCTAGTGDKKTGQPAPATATDSLPFPVYGKFADLEPLLHRSNDTTYVVNFWATWCKPCVAEMPYFEQLQQAYKHQLVQVLLVSMDFPKQYKSKVVPFIRERNLQLPVVALADMDYNSWIDKVSTDWDGAIPFTVIYNAEKKITKLGEMEGYEELEELLESVKN